MHLIHAYAYAHMHTQICTVHTSAVVCYSLFLVFIVMYCWKKQMKYLCKKIIKQAIEYCKITIY